MDGPDEVAVRQAPLIAGHGHGQPAAWRGWHRHHHRLRHSCQDPDPGTASCAWSSYDQGLIGAAASFVYFDQRARGVAYAVSGGSIWQSTDSGESWSPRADVAASIIRLAADGVDSATLIAATSSGLKISPDSAATWTALSLSGLPIENFDRPIVQPQRMYGSIDRGPLLMSSDGGEHWEMAGSNYPRGDTYAVSVDPRTPLEVLSALQFYLPELASYDGRGAIVRTTDGGVSWQNAYDAAGAVHGLARCLANPDIVIAGTRDGVARSLDNGASWTLTPIEPVSQGSIIGIAINPHDCDDYYALQANRGPVHTRDGGASFSGPLVTGLQLIASGGFPGTLAIDPEDPTHLILSTHGGFYASHDSGEHWAMLPVMLALNVTAVAVSPYQPSEVWLSTWGQGVWTRSNSAAAWERIGIDRLPRDYVSALSLDPQASRVLIGANPPLFAADGQSFNEVWTYGASTSATFHPSDPAIIYMTTQIQGVLKSADSGVTWRQVNEGLPRWSTPSSEGIDARNVVIDPQRPEQLFLATNGHGIYRSDDAASTWTQVFASTEAAWCLVQVPQRAANPARLYACLSGISVSEDAGATWTQLNSGLPTLEMHELLHDAVSGNLYATSGRGIFVLTPGASTWSALDPECEAPVRGMAVMEEAGERYLVVGAQHGVRRLAL